MSLLLSFYSLVCSRGCASSCLCEPVFVLRGLEMVREGSLVLLSRRGWMDSGKERKQVGGFVVRCFALGSGLGVMRLLVVVVVGMVGWMLMVVALR
jgi:hypothetical protein